MERLNEAGEWQLLTRGGSDGIALEAAAFGSAASSLSDDRYVSPYITIEQEGPQLIEKPVWADTNGDGILEQTSQKDFFASNEVVTDRDVDTVTITGSSLRDYFLIGHEVLQTGQFDEDGEPITETKPDTLRLRHRTLNSDGTINNTRQVTITVRGIDLRNLAEQVSPDSITVDSETEMTASSPVSFPNKRPSLNSTLLSVISFQAMQLTT